jgi:hypothetical protein
MVSFPEPEDPAVIVSHGWSLCVVHVHPAVSATVKVPAPEGADCRTGDNEYVQLVGGAGALCVTVSCTEPPAPDTVIRPVRAVPDVFAVTV